MVIIVIICQDVVVIVIIRQDVIVIIIIFPSLLWCVFIHLTLLRSLIPIWSWNYYRVPATNLLAPISTALTIMLYTSFSISFFKIFIFDDLIHVTLLHPAFIWYWLFYHDDFYIRPGQKNNISVVVDRIVGALWGVAVWTCSILLVQDLNSRRRVHFLRR